MIYINWKDDFKKGFDNVYEFVKEKYPDVRFPCYGGRYYWFFITRSFESLHFYLTRDALIYTSSGIYVTKIPFDKIKKISVRRGILLKSSFRIRIVADRKYHLQINEIKDFSTKLTGNSKDNAKNFIDTLLASAGKAILQ